MTPTRRRRIPETEAEQRKRRRQQGMMEATRRAHGGATLGGVQFRPTVSRNEEGISYHSERHHNLVTLASKNRTMKRAHGRVRAAHLGEEHGRKLIEFGLV